MHLPVIICIYSIINKTKNKNDSYKNEFQSHYGSFLTMNVPCKKEKIMSLKKKSVPTGYKFINYMENKVMFTRKHKNISAYPPFSLFRENLFLYFSGRSMHCVVL